MKHEDQRLVDPAVFDRVYADYLAGKYPNMTAAGEACGVSSTTFGRLKLRKDLGKPIYGNANPPMSEEQFRPVYEQWKTGAIELHEACRKLGIDSRNWNYYRVKVENGIPFKKGLSAAEKSLFELERAPIRAHEVTMTEFLTVYQMYKEHRITGVLAAQKIGVPLSRFLWWCRAYANGQDMTRLFQKQAGCPATSMSFSAPVFENDVKLDDELANAHVFEKDAGWLRDQREKMGISIERMAKMCRVSVGLLRIVEDGSVTHPHIASRIAKQYRLSVSQYNAIVPKQHWRTGENFPRPVMPPRDRTMSEVVCKYHPERNDDRG